MKARAAYRAIEEQVATVHRKLIEHVLGGGNLALVKAPPGSGKTYLLLEAAKRAVKKRLRVAVATQTNTQADDICRRLDADGVPSIRFAGTGRPVVDLGPSVAWETKAGKLPVSPCIVVGPSAKWGLVGGLLPFDVVFVEEAWQLSWSDFMLLRQVAGRFVLIGDPGQVPPVVSTDVSRWVTAPRAPHEAAPEVLLEEGVESLRLSLPATRRLPSDTVDLIESFYDFRFDALAQPGERVVEPNGRSRDAADAALDLLREGTAVGLTLPTPDGGPPLECDLEVAEAAVHLAARLLARETTCVIDGERRPLRPEEIGLCATHRIMNGAMEMRLPAKLKGKVAVDTPERWQGLERKVLIMVHPLSGVVTPSDFDLETGRLCVMASRHKAGLIVLTRDHLSETLEEFLPRAEQPVGRPDVAGRGHARNLAFWTALETTNRVVEG